MAEFVVDFNESLTQLAEFQLRMKGVGNALDALESQSGKSVSASRKAMSTMASTYTELEKALVSVGADNEKVGQIMERVRSEATKAMAAVAAANLKATTAAQAYNGEMSEMMRLMNDTATKNAYVSSQQRMATLNTKMANQYQELKQLLAAMSSEEARENEILKAKIGFKRMLASADEKARQTSTLLRKELEELNSERAEDDAITRQLISNRRSELAETTRLDGKLQELERTYRGLEDGLQRQITDMQNLVNIRKQEIAEAGREDAQIAKLKRTLDSLNNGRQEEITRLNALITARKKAIAETMSERKAVDELQQALAREEATLVKLKAQQQLVSGEHGRRVAQIKQQITEQERLNKLSAMTTAQLLGLSASQGKVNLSQQLGSQSAAMLRAGLTGLHASVGMYTSATVLAATATYGISAALRDTVITGAEFQATMSRAKAVMSTNTDFPWMKAAGEQASATEMQVRALGQTTVFTASEVAEGLQQLGQAGLSSSEAVTALKPALQLANLANVDMARSADIATNVLMTFGMKAKDLQKVVDLMATAVNNSNADIEQLANSLTYAGPAAQTAGYTIQDTTAAIEAMANAGIKASRSGTALRRLFTNLLNPTKKGQEVLDKYGISVLDAEGNARKLTDVVGSLSNALKNVSGPERLGAITNLVGVYASSAVTSLVDSNDLFQKFAKQNMNVTGAGDAMEKIISDNLKFDWKEMLSALEELQLQAFDSMGMSLRELTATASLEILKMMEPVNKMMGADGNEVNITGLDRLIVNTQRAAETIGLLVAGVVAYKVATGNVFGAFAGDMKGAGDRLRELAARMTMAKAATDTAAVASLTMTQRLEAMKVSMLTATSSVSGMTGAAASAAGGLSRMAAAMSLVMRSLGWVGLIAGIGSALYSVFGNDTDEMVLAHKEGIDETKTSYDKLKAAIEDTGLARQRAALNQQVKEDQGSIKQLEERIKQRENLIKAGQDIGTPESALQTLRDDVESMKAGIDTYRTKIDDSKASLTTLGKTTNDYSMTVEEQATRIQTLINLTDQLTLARANLAVSMASSSADFGSASGGVTPQLIAKLEQDVALAQSRVDAGPQEVQRAKGQVVPLSKVFADSEAEVAATAAAETYKKTVPLAQQLADVERKITEEKKVQKDLAEQDDFLIKNNRLNERPGKEKSDRSISRMTELETQRLELQKKVTEEADKLTEARESASAITRTDAENMVAYRKQLADLAERIKAEETQTDPTKVPDAAKLTDLYRDQAKVLGQIKALEGRDGKASRKADNDGARAEKKSLDELKRQQESDLRTYEGLAKKFDAVSASQLELKKGTEAMARLRAAGTITVQQEAKALGELNLVHYEAVKALDKEYVALEKLRDSYGQSAFGAAADDLAILNKGLQNGTIKLEEYNRIYGQIRAKQLEQATSGLPTANLSVGEASSSPFTDFVSTSVEFSSGMKDYDQRQLDLEKSLEIQLAANERERDMQLEKFEQMYADQEEFSEHALAAERQYQENKTAIQRTASEQQGAVLAKAAQYQKEMSDMALIGMMGAAGNVLGMFASASKDASTAQKAAFAAQKALAVAQIIVYTEVAAARAGAELGPFGLPLATIIRATGYANAGLVAAMAIGNLSSGSESSSGGGTQMYDTGGYIPYNRQGIVGEYGPELVSGPAHVTGRGNTAAKLAGSSNSSAPSITLAPVIQISMPSGAGAGDKESAMQAADTVRKVVLTEMQTAIRPQGLLDNWLKSTRV